LKPARAHGMMPAMNAQLQLWLKDETERRRAFPVLEHHVFLAHAGVCPLPRVAQEALTAYAHYGAQHGQDDETLWRQINGARRTAAELIGAQASEIALLGPTALGLSLVANGWPWVDGDEVVYYADDYPANVYPWLALRERGVRPVALAVEQPGAVTWQAVERALTPRTRMVALASCHYLTGFRIDVDGIGRRLRERGILFCLDGIQSLGAFPTSVEWVDFLSADSHKWMLGPVGAGLFYVRREHHDRLKPTLLGAWNVESPEFVAQSRIAFYDGARRYEPGSLNFPGILAMDASLRLLLDLGIETIADRLLTLRARLCELLGARGFRLPPALETADPRHRSGIVSVTHPKSDLRPVVAGLARDGICVSLRAARDGTPHLRFSPHCYNTDGDLDRVEAVLNVL
jgi:cysteine desulfurase / selenocysteine lyase